jgi:ABC-type microcin C transport system permease subunit YejE
LVFCTKKNLATLLFKTMPRFYLVSILSTAFQLNLGLTARVSLSGSLMSKISEKNGGKKVSGGKIAK